MDFPRFRSKSRSQNGDQSPRIVFLLLGRHTACRQHGSCHEYSATELALTAYVVTGINGNAFLNRAKPTRGKHGECTDAMSTEREATSGQIRNHDLHARGRG